MKMEGTQLYVNYADLERMPMRRQSAPSIKGQPRSIFASSAEHVQFATR